MFNYFQILIYLTLLQILLQMEIILRYQHSFQSSEVTFILNNKKYQNLRIPYQSIFESSSEIVLKPSNPSITHALLAFLSGQTNSIKIALLPQIIKQAKHLFNVDLQVDFEDFACKMIDQIESAQKEITVDILDSLSVGNIIKIIQKAREYTDSETQNMLTLLADAYIKGSKRTQSQKLILKRKISRSVRKGSVQSSENAFQFQEKPKKENKKQKDQKYQKYQKYSKKQPIQKFEKQEKFYKQNRDQFVDKSYKLQSKQKLDKPTTKIENQKHKNIDKRQSFKYQDQKKLTKQKIRDLVNLGIFGSSTENWRQRSRPWSYKSQHYYRDQTDKVLVPSQVNTRPPVKVYEVPESMKEKKLFCYPHDENILKLTKECLPFCIYLQPQNIHISFFSDNVKIKFPNGRQYKRGSKYVFLQKGILGEGITIVFNGLSLIEDGGSQQIQSQIENVPFLNSWFYIQQATISKLE